MYLFDRLLLAVQDEGKVAQKKGSAAEEEEAEDERKIQVTLKRGNRGITILRIFQWISNFSKEFQIDITNIQGQFPLSRRSSLCVLKLTAHVYIYVHTT